MKMRKFGWGRKRGRSALGTLGLIAVGIAGGLGLGRLLWRSRARRREGPPLHTVPFVDLPRYMGTWYEIASFPQRYQRGCMATTATYSMRGAGEVEVVNRCRLHSVEGPEKVARGRARVVDPVTNARLKVQFFWPFWSDYWIIELDPDYSWAVVATPDRDGLWILSRTPHMDDQTFAGIVTRVVRQGFEIGRMNRTVQPGSDPSPMRGF